MSRIHTNAVRQTQAAKTELGSSQKALEEATVTFRSLQQQVKDLTATVADLTIKAGANPKKHGPALTKAKAQLQQTNEALGKHTKVLQDAAVRQLTDLGDLQKAKQAAFDIAKQERIGGAFWVDSLEDAASLPLEVQRQLIGAEIGVDARQALAADVKSVQQAVQRLPPDEALKVLNTKLQGIDPAHQATFLDGLRPELKQLATPAATLTVMEPKAIAAGEAWLEAMHGISPDARKVMASTFAEVVGTTRDWREGVNHVAGTGLGTALDASLKGGGKHFGTARELSAALTDANKPEAAAGMRWLVAHSASELRTTFEAKASSVMKLRGELALLNEGVGSLMSDPQRQKAIEAFKAEHAKEFAAFDQAAAAYSDVLGAYAAPTASANDGGRYTYGDNKQFDAEMLALTKHLPSIQSTPGGEKEILAALEAQAAGVGPPWLGALADVASKGKGLTEGTANVVAMGIAQLAARGSLGTQRGVATLLEKNAALLGIPAKGLETLKAAFSNVDGTKESIERVQKALTEVEGGAFGRSAAAKNSVKLIGLALSVYGVANGFKQWDAASATAKLKTLVDTANVGVDGGKLLFELVGKKGVAESLSKLGGGLAVVNGVLDGLAAVKEFRDGNIGAGIATGLTSAGGLLMGAATLSGSFPGGQLVGATLAVAGLVAGIVVGRREERKAEAASEKDALAYLKGGGVPDASAKKLANVRRSDHRNVGVPVRQIAERLGVNPNVMFERLQKLPPAKLDEFVKRMLALELKGGKVVEGPLSPNPTEKIIDDANVHTEQFFGGSVQSDTLHEIHYAPRSLSTATEWARKFLADNGV